MTSDGAAPRSARWVVAAVLATSALVAVTAHSGDGARHNRYVADSLEITPVEGLVGIGGEPGIIGITSLVRLDPTAPVTILHAEPYRMSPGTALVGVRMMFHGRGRSPGGYLMFQGLPLGYCAPRLDGGFGRSYPVEGLAIEPGDPAQLLYYVQSGDAELEVVTRYRITYRTATGAVRTITGDQGRLEMDLGPDYTGLADCPGELPNGWVEPMPGYPG